MTGRRAMADRCRDNHRGHRTGAALLALMALAGCARFTDRPLSVPGTSIAVLEPPVPAVLLQQSAAIERPFLTPVAIDLAVPLDRNAIGVLAVLQNPDLAALRARAGISEAQVFAAGLLPDPTFSFGIDHLLAGPDPVDNIVAGLGFNLTALRTRGLNRHNAQAAQRQVRLDLAWAEWQTAQSARLQAARILAQREILANAQLSAVRARDLLARYLRAAGRGDIAADQVQTARLSAQDAEIEARAAATDLDTATFALRRLLGLPPAYPLVLAPEPAPAIMLPAERLFALAMRDRADLAALRAGYDAQQGNVRKAVLEQFPTLDLTLSATRDSSQNKFLGPGIAFTLPLWNRNRGAIRIEEATREALHAEYDARLFQTRAEIAVAVSGLAIARRQGDVLRAELPGITAFAAATRRAATRGDLAIATAELAEQTVRDRRLRLLQSEQAIAEQTIALELLVGAPREAWGQ